MTPSEVFERCNETELYQRCKKAGMAVRPGTKKEELILYLLGEEKPLPIENEVDSWRIGLIGFLLDYWSMVRAQISCPAKILAEELDKDRPRPDWESRVSDYRNPKACFTCLDTQVLSCIIDNETNRSLIQLKKKPVPVTPSEDSMTVAVATVNIDAAPRDVATLAKLGRYQLRRLAETLGVFTSEKDMSNFLSEPQENQAQTVQAALARHDANRGTNGAQAPMAAPAAVAEPVPATTARRGRQPSNNGANGAATPAPEAVTVPGGVLDLGPIVGAIAEMNTLLAGVSSRLDAVESAVKNGQKETLTQLRAATAVAKVQLGFTGLLAEQVLGAPRDEILADAVKDGEAFMQKLGKG